MRGFWDGSEFVLAAADLNKEALCDFLQHRWVPTPYARWWKGDREIAKARSWQPDLQLVRMLDAHIVPRGDRNSYNDVLGTGGNVGKRDFAKLSEDCRVLVKKDKNTGAWLEQTLFGCEGVELPVLPSTGTWFAHANKAFNSGWSAAREGQLSPWSYLLALEGALLLQGGAAKRLGARTKAYATFPFMSEAAPPENANELGKERSEFRAPVWTRAATSEQVILLLRRSQARVGQRAARAPFEFAAAAMTAGTQMGIDRFVPFLLRQTTSSNTYEALQGGIEEVKPLEDEQLKKNLIAICDWAEGLPEDQASSQKSVYYGLRGPINKALLGVAQEPKNSEKWRAMLNAIGDVQLKVDRSKKHKEHAKPISFLHPDLFKEGWPGNLSIEARIARSIASIRYGRYRLCHNIFGFDSERPQQFFEQRSSVVWHGGEPARVLADVLERRLIDEPKAQEAWQAKKPRSPLWGAYPCSLKDVEAFAAGRVNLELIVKLIPAFSLIDWGKEALPDEESDQKMQGGSPEFLLQGLFRPLLTRSKFTLVSNTEDIKPDAMRARTAVRLLRGGLWQQAFAVADRAYAAAGIRIIRCPKIDVSGDLIAAALLIPTSIRSTRIAFRRWIQKTKR